jgi:phosphoribosylanthranilate isomerase
MKRDARSEKNRAVLQAVHEMHRRLSALAGQSESDIASALSAHVLAQLHGVHVDDPVSYEEAMASEYAEFWKAAMQEEYHSLLENDTWQAADSIVYDKKAIGSKMGLQDQAQPCMASSKRPACGSS